MSDIDPARLAAAEIVRHVIEAWTYGTGVSPTAVPLADIIRKHYAKQTAEIERLKLGTDALEINQKHAMYTLGIVAEERDNAKAEIERLRAQAHDLERVHNAYVALTGEEKRKMRKVVAAADRMRNGAHIPKKDDGGEFSCNGCDVLRAYDAARKEVL